MEEQSLSAREIQVLENISKGYTTKEIARILFLSAHTVISYRKNLMKKLEVENAPAMVRRGFEIGILPAHSSLVVKN